MKKRTSLFLAAVSTLFVSSVSLAFGVPDEDPVIASYRARFEAAKSPGVSELAGKAYSCRSRSARLGDFELHKGGYSFERFDGVLVNVNASFRTVNLEYVSTPDGLIASVSLEKGAIGYDSIRKESDGTLIVEWSVKNASSAGVPAIGNKVSGAVARQYSVCVQK